MHLSHQYRQTQIAVIPVTSTDDNCSSSSAIEKLFSVISTHEYCCYLSIIEQQIFHISQRVRQMATTFHPSDIGRRLLHLCQQYRPTTTALYFSNTTDYCNVFQQHQPTTTAVYFNNTDRRPLQCISATPTDDHCSVFQQHRPTITAVYFNNTDQRSVQCVTTTPTNDRCSVFQQQLVS